MASSVKASTGQPAIVTVNQDLIRQIKQDKAKAQANAFFDRTERALDWSLTASAVPVAVTSSLVEESIKQSDDDTCNPVVKDVSLNSLTDARNGCDKSMEKTSDCFARSIKSAKKHVHASIDKSVR